MFSDSALPVLNGVSVSVDGLVRELRRMGHSVHFFAPGFPGHRETDPNTFRTHSFMTPLAKGYPFAFPPFHRMLWEFRKHEFDVIHTHTPFIVGFVGLRWAESHEIPIVATYHTLYDRYAYYLPFLPRRYVRYKIAKHTHYYYNRVSHVICPSRFALKWLKRHKVTTSASIIPTGGLERKFLERADCRQNLGISPDEFVMLYVGRIAKEKNLETLFGAAKQVMGANSKARLWVVGDGPFFESALAIVRDLGIGNKVKFVGFVQRPDVDQYYAAADAFVFSSITETQGLVVQEAMLYGLPPVCVIGGGASEAVVDGFNGFLVRNDPKAFANSVVRLMDNDDLYARMSARAVESVRDYTTGAMATKVVECYRDAIGRRDRQMPIDEPIRLL